MDGRSAQGQGTTCWRSRTTPTSRTGACTRPRSISTAARSTGPMRRSRMRNEPLIEIKQIKGQSETHPLLSPNDEFANFEILTLSFSAIRPGRIPHVIGSYARQALKDGLALQDTKGFNPYKFGFGAASNSHQHRRALSPGQLLRGPRHSPTEPSRSACPAHLFAGMDHAPRWTRRADRCLGGGEHARVDLQCHAAQGDLRGQRPASQGSLFRRLELCRYRDG